jgi:hypothetical protein
MMPVRACQRGGGSPGRTSPTSPAILPAPATRGASGGPPAGLPGEAPGYCGRRRAADELGVEDPEGEFRRWLEEGSVGRGGAGA